MLVIWILKMMFLGFLGIPTFYGIKLLIDRLNGTNGIGKREDTVKVRYDGINTYRL